MNEPGHIPADAVVHTPLKHALGWLVFGNAVGLYLSLLLLFPNLQLAHWTYGRWVPVHLNVQLYGWTSLPLVAWLFSIYQVGASKARVWAPAAVWGWTAALALGALQWLNGVTSGKIFLDWKGGGLWAFVAAQAILWVVLAAAWMERSRRWSRARRYGSLAGLVGLAMVPVSLVFAASPAVYPPVDRTTGGPTGSSLLGSALVVVGLMLLLPRVCSGDSCDGSPSCAQPPRAGVGTHSRSIFKGWGIWVFFGVSWFVFGVTESLGGTHFQALQIVAMLMLLPWVWWLPLDWAGFSWPEGSRYWRGAMFGWWGLLVVSGLLMYQPGVLDHIKFTQGLVAHSHLAMAGFTTSFCTLLLVLLSGRPLGGGRSVMVWQTAALVMIVTLAWMGWREGDSQGWMIERPLWRELGMWIRIGCGVLLVSVPVIWFKQWRDT